MRSVCFQLLLAGLQDIDVKDWQANTIFKNEYNPNHPVIVNFWKVWLACHRYSTRKWLS